MEFETKVGIFLSAIAVASYMVYRFIYTPKGNLMATYDYGCYSESENDDDDDDGENLDIYKMILDLSKNKKSYDDKHSKKINSKKDLLLKSNVIIITERIEKHTYFKFIDSYNKIDKNKDIYLIINTGGGEAHPATAICNYILGHIGKGKFISLVAGYAFSGGTKIALCCDQIMATNYALFGPCDVQLYNKNDSTTMSSSNIREVITYQEKNDRKITENLLFAGRQEEKITNVTSKFIDKLCDIRGYNKDILYDEFFSGKYDHGEMFTGQDLIDLNIGLNILIADECPIKI